MTVWQHTPLSINIVLRLWEANMAVKPARVLAIILLNLRAIHAVWRMKTFAKDDTLARYEQHVGKFAQAWNVLGWKGTVWVHWTIAHSACLLHKHRSLYIFRQSQVSISTNVTKWMCATPSAGVGPGSLTYRGLACCTWSTTTRWMLA